MSSWRTALRIARREARRSKGRSTLVCAMIMLPVLALSFGVTLLDMFELRTDEKLNRAIGAADARMAWEVDGPLTQDVTGDLYATEQPRNGAVTRGGAGQPLELKVFTPGSADLLALLPQGSRVTQLEEASIGLKTPTGTGGMAAWGIDIASPLTRGIVELLDGRAPERDDEVTLTERAADRLDVRLGGKVHLDNGSRSFTVVGLIEFPDDLGEAIAFRPGVLSANLPADRQPWGRPWLVDTPTQITWADVKTLNQRGITVQARSVILDPPPASDVAYAGSGSRANGEDMAIGGVVAGLGILEIVLLAGPAFAVGARRRQRELALVAANGGTPAHLRRIVLADGLFLGLLGAALGVVLGIGLAFATHPLAEWYVAQSRAGGYRVFPLAQLGIVGLAVLTGLLAALVPAFTTARQNVVLALAGRRGITRSRKRWLALGGAMVAAGAALATFGAHQTSANVVLAGLVVGELGLVLCTPALVGLIARIGRVLPLAPRIALRDTARNRASAAPAISAVMAAVAGSVAIAVYFNAESDRVSSTYTPGLKAGNAVALSQDPRRSDDDSTAIARVARESLPVTGVSPIRMATCVTESDPEPSHCGVMPVMPVERRCPYAQLNRDPTRAEQRAALRDRRCTEPQQYWSDWIPLSAVIDDGPAVAALTGATGDDLANALATLRAGGVVVGDPRYVLNGRVTLSSPSTTAEGARPVVEQTTDGQQTDRRAEPPTVTVPGYGLTGTKTKAITIISTRALPRLGITAKPGGVVIATSATPTREQEEKFAAAVRKISPAYFTRVERGSRAVSDDLLTLLILAAVAGLVTLGAAGIATGLAAADSRADLATLAAVGASPRVRRMLSLSQSGMISGLGSLLGAVAGLGAAVAVLSALNRRYLDTWPVPTPFPITVPWLNLAIALLVVPAVAMLGAGLLTRSRLPIERRL